MRTLNESPISLWKEKLNIKLKITTSITVDDNITGEDIEKIRSEFEDVAWENNMIATQPKVSIEEVTDEASISKEMKE